METLHDILWAITNEELNYRVKLLEKKPQSQRKADLIDAIKGSFEGRGLKELWLSLNELEQAAVAEACYAPDLLHHESRIEAKYGSLPSFCEIPKGDRFYSFTRWDSKYATRLNLFLFANGRLGGRFVPSDLAERLREFVPMPAKLAVPTLEAPAEEKGLYVRRTEFEALSEVLALLRLAEQGGLRVSAKTGMVPAASRRKMEECFSGGDFFPEDVAYPRDKKSYEQEIGAIKPIAWARLLKVGGYFTCSGTQSKLTPAGIKALSLPPHEIIRHLWKKWLPNSVFDEFNRVDDIKGQGSKGHMTAKPPRRQAIAGALSECPANQWIPLSGFSKYMQAANHEFKVSSNAWKLYLYDAKYGSLGYDGHGKWNIIQFRYILCLLFEYAATLGLVDIAYVHPRDGLNDYTNQWGGEELGWLSRYDGLRAFRITKLGAYCFGLVPDFVPERPVSSLELTVFPNLSIEIRSGAVQPADRLLLETWAEPVDASTWRLEPGRARDAVERGQKAADFVAFLERGDSQPLPETVLGFFKTCERDGRAVKNLGEACLFECRDAATTEVICSQTQLQGLCFRCGETQLAVPSANLQKFRKLVRSLGLGFG